MTATAPLFSSLLFLMAVALSLHGDIPPMTLGRAIWKPCGSGCCGFNYSSSPTQNPGLMGFFLVALAIFATSHEFWRGSVRARRRKVRISLPPSPV
ncbi:MAG: hypothetical protein IPO22_13605 [Anaerolineales bacterium]|nr:hypothetical protein [Anaerolineales bacterium]